MRCCTAGGTRCDVGGGRVVKLCVTGSRSITDRDFIRMELEQYNPFDPDCVIHGVGSPVDKESGVWARANDIEVDEQPVPDWAWDRIGRKSGPLRNSYMVSEADCVFALWHDGSKGTGDTITKAVSKGIPTCQVLVECDDGEFVVDERSLRQGDQTMLHDFEQ
jgi:hypothetical protein